MRRGIIVACLTLMVPALLLFLADRSRTTAQEAARVAQRQLVEVGKTYNFWTTSRWMHCKVVEAPLADGSGWSTSISTSRNAVGSIWI